MEMLFNQLKRELLNPANGLEDNFTLLVELRNSTLKNFAIKKLFWKVCNSPKLLNFKKERKCKI